MPKRLIKYIEGDSAVHRLDPRAKLLFILSLLFSLSISSNFLELLPLFVISLLFYLNSHLPWSKTKPTWKLILTIILVLSTLNLLTLTILYSGARSVEEAAAKMFSVDIISKSFLPIVKLLTLAVATVTFIFTTPPNLYAPALGQMGVPYKLAYIVQLALRYIPEYIDDMGRTLEAQMARGYRPKGGRNPFTRILAVVPLVVPVTISATLSIYDIADAMELRGFGEKKCHTWYRKLSMKTPDKTLIAASIAIAAAYTLLFILKTT